MYLVLIIVIIPIIYPTGKILTCLVAGFQGGVDFSYTFFLVTTQRPGT
nr:MAG TPA: hypothetical protein [Caudoviricetes sp.]